MSRWAWHEKKGPRKGPIKRRSDYLSALEEEEMDRERHQREWDYIYKYLDENGRHPNWLDYIAEYGYA